MTKHLIAFTATLILAFALFGCSSTSNSASQSAAASSSEQSQTSALFVADEWPQNDITEGVPAPKFSVSPTSTSTSNNSIDISYENVPASEVESYIEEVKAADFVYQARENKSSDSYIYQANNNENVLNSKMIIVSYNSTGMVEIALGKIGQ